MLTMASHQGLEDDASDGGRGLEHTHLAHQITEVQGMIHELKDGFLLAMQELSKIQNGDQALHEKVETNKTEQQKQLKEVLDMVLSLKSEFEEVVSQLHEANESQQSLQKQVESLQYERDILLDELNRTGNTPRQKHGSKSSGHVQCVDGHHSDHDSGVNPLGLSDDELSQSGLSPMVKPYIASLRKLNQSHLSEDGYDSDSSVAKMLNLSRSFGQMLKQGQCSSGDDSSECGSVDRSSKHSGSSSGQKSLSVTPRIPRRKVSTDSIDSLRKAVSVKRRQRVPPHEQAMTEGQKSRYGKELLESERLFCSGLWTLMDVFMEPLKESGCLDTRDISSLFPPSVSNLYEHHCCILKRLEERMANSKWQGVIGDIFAWFINNPDMDIFAVYRTYLHDIPDSVKTVNRLYADMPVFRKYLKKYQRNPSCKGHDLIHFLLMPVQRIPQYILILKQLIKLTDADHPDFFNLESSLGKLRKFLHELNESVELAMRLVRNDGAMDSARSNRSSTNNSLKSSVSSQDGFPVSIATKDSGIHSNGEEAVSPETNKKTAPSVNRKSNYIKGDVSKYRKVKLRDSVEPDISMGNSCQNQGNVVSNRTTKEKPTRVRKSSLDGVIYSQNGAMETDNSDPTVKLRKKWMEKRAKTASVLYTEHSNALIPNGVETVQEVNYAIDCQTLPTRGQKARKQKMNSALAEVQEAPISDRLNLESGRSSINGAIDEGGEEEVAYEPSGKDSPGRLSKQKLGMIHKWRSQGDILGEDNPDMVGMLSAKSLSDITPAEPDMAMESVAESETGSSLSNEKTRKSKRRGKSKVPLDVSSITPLSPPDAFKTKKKTFKDTVKNIFKRSSRSPKAAEEVVTIDGLGRTTPSVEMNSEQYVAFSQQQMELGSGAPLSGATGYSDSEEEYDEDGEPCSAV